MNVIRMDNTKVRPTRGRGKGRGRDHLYWKSGIEKPITNAFCQPKYQSSSSQTPQNVFNLMPSSSSAKTPSSARRVPGIPSSSSARIKSSSSTNLQRTVSTADTLDSTVIMAITSGRGDARSEVGMAAIDIKFPHLIISQISDTQTYSNTLMMIHFFNPVEILMPDTMCGDEDPRKKLYSTVKSKFKDIQITSLWRMHFNEENGLDRVKTHRADEFSSIELYVKEKYYALSATAALLKYVEQIQHIIYEPKSMKIEFQASQGSTLIDIESAINLELVSSQGPQKNHNLFSSLDRCVTPMGRRLLRSSILQPLCDENIILKRQACVTELVRNRNLHTSLQPIVKQLFGADRLLGLSMRTAYSSNCVETAERNLNYILLLKTCLDVIPQLSSALEAASSPNFVKIRKNLKDPRFQTMKKDILEIVQDDARSVNGYTSANMQRCFALKSGINDTLDITRQTYCELMEQTTVVVESLAKEYRLSLSVACNASLGYHIQMQEPKHPDFKISDLPAVFIEVQKKKNKLYMTTNLLMSLSQQCKEIRNNLYIMSSCILEVLITTLRNQVACLFQLSEDIAELDLVMSIARISGIPDYVKPTFGQNLRIIDSKHPIVDLLANELPRPNNIEASVAYNFCNITGPNMSGKSTYLKQVVLLHIMAQIGCYLPAKEAILRVTDRIFCRLCPTFEDIESDASSFIQEIREVDYILQFITPTSLIVLDEICRSTNSEEGAPIAFAICENLLQSTAFIFNCTHFLSLTKLTELYPNALNFFFVCEPNELDKWGLTYTHKLRKGVTSVENYGISAASACRLPKVVIEKSKQLVGEIAQIVKPLPLVKAPKLSWQKDCYDCISKIMNLIISDEYTLENVKIAVNPLRGNSNLKFPLKDDLLSNVLQKNFQRNAPGDLLKTINSVESQTRNVIESNSKTSKIQYSSSVSNRPESSEGLNGTNVRVESSNITPNNIRAFNAYEKSKELNLQRVVNVSNNNKTGLIKSNLSTSQSPFQYKSSKDSFSNKGTFQKNIATQKEESFSFKVPDLISPAVKNKKGLKTKSKYLDMNQFVFKKKASPSLGKSRSTIKTLSGMKTLFNFGFFSKEKTVDQKCVDNRDFEELSNKDDESLTNSSNLQTPNLSNLLEEETSSNTSFYLTRSPTNSDFNQDQTCKKQEFNFSNLSSPKNWIQRERIVASDSTKRILDNNEFSRSPSNLISNNSRNSLEEETESQRSIDESKKSQYQEQNLSNRSSPDSFQRKIESQNSILEKNEDFFKKSGDLFKKSADIFKKNEGIFKSSEDIFEENNSRKLFGEEPESRSSYFSNNINESKKLQFQKQNLSILTSPGSFQRDGESRNSAFKTNEDIFEKNYQFDQDNISRRSSSQKHFPTHSRSSFEEEIESRSNSFVNNIKESKKSQIEKKNQSDSPDSFHSKVDSRSGIFKNDSLFKNSGDIFKNNEDIFKKSEAILKKTDHIFKEYKDIFDNNYQFNQDNISRRSSSLKHISTNSRTSFDESKSRSNSFINNDSKKSQFQNQNLSNLNSLDSFQNESQNGDLEKDEEISSRSQFQSPVRLLREDEDSYSKKSLVTTPKSILTEDNVSRRSHLMTPNSLLLKDVYRRPQLLTPNSFLTKDEDISTKSQLTTPNSLKNVEDNISRRSQIQTPRSLQFKSPRSLQFQSPRSLPFQSPRSSQFQSPRSSQFQHLDSLSKVDSTKLQNYRKSETKDNFNLNTSRNSVPREIGSQSSFFKNSQSRMPASVSETARTPSFENRVPKTPIFETKTSVFEPQIDSLRSREYLKRPPSRSSHDFSKSQQLGNSRSCQAENKSRVNLNISSFSVPKKIEFLSSIFGNSTENNPEVARTSISKSREYLKKPLSQNRSHSSIHEKIESESVPSKKMKLSSNSENQDVSLNLINSVADTVSSLNSANFSFLLDTSPVKRSTFHNLSQNNESLRGSQQKLASQKPMSAVKKIENKYLVKNDGELISLSSESITISEFESVLDDDTVQIDDISEFPSPKRDSKESDVYTISSEDTIQAADNVRRREEEIFKEIEENATDGEMFLQRLLNSPLSAPCSEELCSCSYSSLNELSS